VVQIGPCLFYRAGFEVRVGKKLGERGVSDFTLPFATTNTDVRCNVRMENLPTTDFGRLLRHPKRTYPGVPAAPVVVHLAAKKQRGLRRAVRANHNQLA